MKHNAISAIAMTLLVTAGAHASAPRGVDRANLDPSVAPGTDFYDYACGGWMKAHPLSDEYSRYGTFDMLGELNRTQVRDLVLGLDRDATAPGSDARKIADLYAMGMDADRLNTEGAAAVAADLTAIARADRADVAALLASTPGMGGFYGAYVEADLADAARTTLYFDVAGLGLGDRDYYLENTDDMARARAAYREYLHTLARLVGYDEPAAYRLVGNVMDIETRIARASLSREELRDPAATYNPRSMAAVVAEYPALGADRYVAALGLRGVDSLVVGQTKALAEVNEILADAPMQAVRDYLTADYLSTAAPYLSDDFTDARFALQQVLSGVKEQQPRWKRALAVPNSMLSEALGRLYVAKYFPPESKAKMLDLVGNLRIALRRHIEELTWMSDDTKRKAVEKLDAFTVKIGYPDKWRDYSGLTIDPERPYWNNVQAAIRFNTEYNLADYGKPVNRDKWYMSPQTVNAYYNPTTNEICFPAGILQAPYFNPDADDAENYGAIGVVIGHEMTHGFDDQGRQFDKDGNLANWWTDADAAAFTKLAEGLAAQFDAIEVAPGLHANGHFTLGENIADQGGLRVAHTAYHNALRAAGKPDGEVIDGFTPDQRFYLSYANVWAGNIRPAEIVKRTKTDPHSLGRWRVNASLRNLAPFFEAFSITDGQPMYRPEAERVVIW